MEVTEALKIMRALSDGLNPYTGEILETESIYRNGQTVQALCCATRALQRREEQERRRQLLPANTGKSWSSQEDQEISTEYRSGVVVRTIAETHRRSIGAIASRLAKLGLMLPGRDE